VSRSFRFVLSTMLFVIGFHAFCADEPSLPSEYPSDIDFGRRDSSQPSNLLAVVVSGSDVARGKVYYATVADGVIQSPWNDVKDEKGNSVVVRGYAVCVGDILGRDSIDEYVVTSFSGNGVEAHVRVLGLSGAVLNEIDYVALSPDVVTRSDKSLTTYVLGCALGDVDMDGDLDVAVAYSHAAVKSSSEPCRSAVVLIKNDEGKFKGKQTIAVQSSSGGCSSIGDVKLADVNLDGFLDLITAWHGIQIFPNQCRSVPCEDVFKPWEVGPTVIDAVSVAEPGNKSSLAYAHGLSVHVDVSNAPGVIYVADAYSTGDWGKSGIKVGLLSSFIAPRVLSRTLPVQDCHLVGGCNWSLVWPTHLSQGFEGCEHSHAPPVSPIPASDGHSVLLGNFAGDERLDLVLTRWTTRSPGSGGKYLMSRDSPAVAFVDLSLGSCAASKTHKFDSESGAVTPGQGAAVLPVSLVQDTLPSMGPWTFGARNLTLLLPAGTFSVEAVWHAVDCKTPPIPASKVAFSFATGTQWLVIAPADAKGTDVLLPAGETWCVSRTSASPQSKHFLYFMARGRKEEYMHEL
jgi:hypothetical protein